MTQLSDHYGVLSSMVSPSGVDLPKASDAKVRKGPVANDFDRRIVDINYSTVEIIVSMSCCVKYDM